VPVTDSTTSQALSGIRVLDLGRVVAAPYAAQLLGDLGAEVIKIERPGVGDDVRSFGNPLGRKGIGAHFASWNRNKRSITVDLAKPGGQEIVRRLAAKTDVLVENYIPGTMERYGLDYARLSALNRGLIYCSVTAYGHSGPLAASGGMDPVFQARGGLHSVIGDDRVGPVMSAIVLSDCATGRDAANAILAALFERTRSGLGQYIDISLLDSTVALLSHAAQEYLLSGFVPGFEARAQTRSAWGGFLDCADGKVYVLATRNPFFAGLCKVLGLPELAQDPRFATGGDRYDHRAELEAIMRPRVAGRKRAAFVEALVAAGVPAGPVNNARDVFEDAQVQARGMVVPLPSPSEPNLRVVRSPLSLSRTPPTYRRPPPELGQHTREVLQEELGLDEAAIARLQEAGAI
jgi:crotonobetainyl-CoA:carnitine CoA-transferase CaiB-like acyl-CoA transferase